jgi:hypothetical protein
MVQPVDILKIKKKQFYKCERTDGPGEIYLEENKVVHYW